jgi:prepilin signal peptidase PulO-like enzyme (type II secretory pathway)
MAFVLGAAFFAVAAYFGVLLASTIRTAGPFEDGPKPSEPPVLWLMVGFGVVGGLVTLHATSPAQLVLLAILCVVLAAVWCTDVRYGIVPDVFTLTPLAGLLLYALITRQWVIFVSALIPFIPFAIAAAMSGGRGMGWGDVKLAALGGAILGAQTATFAFAVSCLAAVLIAHLRGQRGAPIAFAPYLVAAIAVAMPLGTLI